jgi:general secretion pathway protein F/type IV pilus assembly protein PilC
MPASYKLAATHYAWFPFGISDLPPMPEFTFEALAPTGERSQGTLTANTDREVQTMLDARGLFPVRIELAGGAVAARGRGKRVRARHLATFFSQLADLLRAGVALLRSLEILERQVTQPTLKDILREVRAQVADGTSLADALGQHPRAFNELTVSMVRAGQEGGFLEDVLERIAKFTENQEDLRAKVIGAMAYPIFLAVTGFIILNILILFFVPQFEPIFEKLQEKGQLPALTQALISMSKAFQRNIIAFGTAMVFVAILPFFSTNDFRHLGFSPRAPGEHLSVFAVFRAVIVLLAGAMLVVLLLQEEYMSAVFLGAFLGGLLRFKFWAGSDRGRYSLDAFRLRLPSAGTIYLNLALARFARILGTLLKSGIPILQGLRIAKDSTGNLVLTRAIEQAADNLTHGQKLATPLGANKHFPRDFVEMVAVGEESNQLEKILLDIADNLEKRTARQLELFVRLLEPVMLLVMAGVTLVVVAALLLPVFKMSSAVQ